MAGFKIITLTPLNLESVGAGNLHLEAAGVFWLIVGIVLSTVPSEMAKLVRWFQ